MPERINLLTVEKNRLIEMIQELEDVSRFRWGFETCPVCSVGRDWEAELGENCSTCRGLGIKERCNYIDNFRDGWDEYNKYTNEEEYDKNAKVYLTELFLNYIRQIEEQIEDISNEKTAT